VGTAVVGLAVGTVVGDRLGLADVGTGVGYFVDLAFGPFVAFPAFTAVGTFVFDDFGALACAKLSKVITRMGTTSLVMIFIVPVMGWRLKRRRS
jgi:hypothetical protein